MYDYFSESAQKVVHLASEEAGRLKHDHLTPEHLLLGIIKEEGFASKILADLGINSVNLFSDIESLIGHGEGGKKEISLSPRSKKVLELAYNAARELGFSFVGSEHILLGIIREGESIAAQALHKRKINFDKVVTKIIENIEKEQKEEPPQREIEPFAQEFESPEEPEEGEGGPGMFGFPGFGGGMPGTMMQPPPRKAALASFGRDLTEDAKNGKLDPVIGREKEIERIIRILSRRTKNNPALLGDPGVGKTAIVEGLAERIIKGDVPDVLKDKKVFSLDLGGMVAGTKYRGEFESRVKKVLDEILAKKRQIILFIDELHTLVGAGAAEGAIDAANMLKPALARGELQVIGATTVDEYRKNIEKDAALERRFQPVMITEPSQELTIEILKGIRSKYEEHHGVRIPDQAIISAVSLSDRYISDRFLPDKAIDVMDEAAAKVRLRLIAKSPELKEIQKKLYALKNKQHDSVGKQKFEEAATDRDEIKNLEKKQKELEVDWNAERVKLPAIVTDDDIAEVVSDWTGIPVVKLTQAETEKLIHMEETLHKRIIGQEDAVVSIAQAIRRGRAGLKQPERPVGSFIFAGPTGVGKTEVARRLAEFMFGTMDAMIRIDMSEYMEKHTVSRLIGAPPGYVGYEEGGTLTEAVRRKPYSVVLFDEIEKAHPDVFNVLLQVLDDGRLTDSKGKTIDFKNTVIIMTTNIGQRMIIERGAIGFLPQEDREQDYEKMRDMVLDEMKKEFRPEFLNRVDETIVFHPLSDEELKKIASLIIADVEKQMEGQGMQLEINDEVKAQIVKEGYEPKFGARPLRRAVQKLIENPLSNQIIEGKFKIGDKIGAKVSDGKIVFERIGTADIKPKAKKSETKGDFPEPKVEETKEVSGEERAKKGRKKSK
ncbi:ATP-dependent Clp protease ATP-binding subunit [Candidatus Saganbacteria bacterium]|nr:ATP-dependent Clp protease ATP-binding subunit [Candidatus Saganbacteria bacterium]